MTAAEVEAALEREITKRRENGWTYRVEAVDPLSARVRMAPLEPNGAETAAAVMSLADLALRVAILAHAGPGCATAARTLSFNFVRDEVGSGVVAECRLLKLGRRLAVGEVTLAGAGGPDAVCYATGTYVIIRSDAGEVL